MKNLVKKVSVMSALLLSIQAYSADVLKSEFEALNGQVQSQGQYKVLKSASNFFAPVGVLFHQISPDFTRRYFKLSFENAFQGKERFRFTRYGFTHW